MLEELTLEAPVRYGADFLEFVAGRDGTQQVFRVDASVFTKLLQIERIDQASLANLFMADPGHFLFVAARKLAEQGPDSAPIRLTLADLLR